MKLYLTTGIKKLEVILLQPRKLQSLVFRALFGVFLGLVGFLVFVFLVSFFWVFFCCFYFFKPNYYHITPQKCQENVSLSICEVLSVFLSPVLVALSLLRRRLLCQVCSHTCTYGLYLKGNPREEYC